MQQFVRAPIDQAPVLLLAGVVAIGVWILLSRRRAPAEGGHWVEPRTRILDGLVAISIGAIAGATLLPSSHGSMDLVPLRNWWRDIRVLGVASAPTYAAIGNILLFVPLGALLPLRWPALARLGRITAVCATASVLIELVQLVLPIGRSTAIDDVLMNTLGGALGYAAMSIVRKTVHLQATARRVLRRPAR